MNLPRHASCRVLWPTATPRTAPGPSWCRTRRLRQNILLVGSQFERPSRIAGSSFETVSMLAPPITLVADLGPAAQPFALR
jgi:hypothetical protein